MCKSCVGCKFLYEDGTGYSNYTWMDTWVRCALNLNPKLEGDVESPYEFRHQGQPLPQLEGMRCDRYAPGPMITLDPDREGQPFDYRDNRWDPYDFEDEEQYKAIAENDGWNLIPPFDEYKRGTSDRSRIQPGGPTP